MKIFDNGTYREITQEEISEFETKAKKEQMRRKAIESHRQLMPEEVQEIIIKKHINKMEIEDSLSLKMKSYYPTFTDIVGLTVKSGFKFTYNETLFKTLQEMTIQEQYLPGAGTESLYEVINEQYAGDIYDPIPYEGNMALENGKYYTQDGVTYLCNRDTGNAVYNPLSELVGLYVEVAEIV